MAPDGGHVGRAGVGRWFSRAGSWLDCTASKPTPSQANTSLWVAGNSLVHFFDRLVWAVRTRLAFVVLSGRLRAPQHRSERPTGVAQGVVPNRVEVVRRGGVGGWAVSVQPSSDRWASGWEGVQRRRNS